MKNKIYQHPGIGIEMFLENLNISQKKFSEMIGKNYNEVNQLINGKRGITIDWANRLASFFGGSAQTRLNLQNKYDQYIYKQKKENLNILKK